jgi:hypothetical protein
MIMRFSARAEGEGFEPSRDQTAPSDFRDRLEHAYLQGLARLFASAFASQSCRLFAPGPMLVSPFMLPPRGRGLSTLESLGIKKSGRNRGS